MIRDQCFCSSCYANHTIIRRSMSSINHMSPIGYAFVYFKDDRNAFDAIRGLHDTRFRNDGSRLIVDWAKGERGRHHDGSGPNQRPTKTLFVINYDPKHTREYDIERHFERYGKIRNVRIHQNYAFVQFETQEDATKALNNTKSSKILGRVISVEYAIKDDDEGRYDGSTKDYRRRECGAYRRLPAPAYGIRSSPDYGRYTGPSSGPSTRSPDPVTYQRSPSPAHSRIRSSPDYSRYTGPSSGPSTRTVRCERSRSPAHRHIQSSPSTRSPNRVRYRSRSPGRR